MPTVPAATFQVGHYDANVSFRRLFFIAHLPEHRRGHDGVARGSGQSAASWGGGEAGNFAAASRHQPFDRLPIQPGNPEQDSGSGFVQPAVEG